MTTKSVTNVKSTASKIRELNAKGLSRSEIAKKLGIRYQWVRNVLITPIKSEVKKIAKKKVVKKDVVIS